MSEVGRSDALERRHYDAVFAVLEACERCGSVAELGEAVTESLASAYDMGSTTFFSGDSLAMVFADPAPVIIGSTRPMLPEYQEKRWRDDVFSAPTSMRALFETGVATLFENHRLAPEHHAYVVDYLQRHRVHAAAAVSLQLPGGRRGLVGLFDRDDHRIGPREVQSLRLLVRPLNRITQALPDEAAPSDPLSVLSPRHAEVARLVAEGLGNAAIGEILVLHHDSVKKYVSRILTATGCANRTELALRVRAARASHPLPSEEEPS